MRTDEIFGLRLMTTHNLYFLINFMKKMREAILEDFFVEFRSDFIANYKK